MTKGEMLANINISIKWAMDNDADILEMMKCRMLDYGFDFRGWGWKANRRMMKLHKDELMDLMNNLIECIY